MRIHPARPAPMNAGAEQHYRDLADSYHQLLAATIEDLDDAEFTRTGRRSTLARELRAAVHELESAE